VVAHDASDEQLRTTYGELGTDIVVYGHIHHPFIRELEVLTIANSGSVSLALDGDVRAKYAVVEDGRVHHRQIVYDVEQVARAMLEMDYPSAEMYATWLRTGRRD
jgi:predicted phosphodiesterase